jgi:hypothetical protein
MRALLAWLMCATPLFVRGETLAEFCDRQLPAVQVEVRATVAEPSISFELSAAQIKQIARNAQPGVQFGLTEVETRMEQRASFTTLRGAAERPLCARPRIELTLALYRARVNVARELVGDECAVAAVWHHELRHFAISQEALAAAASELERMMRAYYEGAVLFGSEIEVQEQIEREFHERWALEFEALQARDNLAQAALDAQDAQLDERLCDGALARLAARLTRQAPP